MIARLGQWFPRFPDPGRPMAYDPVATDLARRINLASLEIERLAIPLENARMAWEDALRYRVGLAPALFEDPRNLADPAMQRAYMEWDRTATEYEQAVDEVQRLQAEFRARMMRRRTPRPVGMRSFRLPFVSWG